MFVSCTERLTFSLISPLSSTDIPFLWHLFEYRYRLYENRKSAALLDSWSGIALFVRLYGLRFHSSTLMSCWNYKCLYLVMILVRWQLAKKSNKKGGRWSHPTNKQCHLPKCSSKSVVFGYGGLFWHSLWRFEKSKMASKMAATERPSNRNKMYQYTGCIITYFYNYFGEYCTMAHLLSYSGIVTADDSDKIDDWYDTTAPTGGCNKFFFWIVLLWLYFGYTRTMYSRLSISRTRISRILRSSKRLSESKFNFHCLLQP